MKMFENIPTVKYVYVLVLNKTISMPFASRLSIFAVSNKKKQWSLDFGPDFFILTVKDLMLELTKSSQITSLPAWNLFSQKEESLNNLLDRIPFHSQPARKL